MLAKKTSKNQLTLPKAVIARFPDVEYFEVTEEDGRIILQPARFSRAGEVRERLAALGISEGDIGRAVSWAREN